MDKKAHQRLNHYYQWTYRFNVVATLITILAVEVMVLLHITGMVVMVAG